MANRLDLRPAAELLGGWPGSNLFAFMHKCGSHTERVNPFNVMDLFHIHVLFTFTNSEYPDQRAPTGAT